ncbi:MAG: putative metallophosphoesterase [Pelotomaculum sp. PtaB.Bin013]|uniref:Metallophosphoesterase n=1 Tax=Pelotomaculum isophthalicicum JI TaxID=947010 RepID=A0A9X4JVR5_9FIRM|nr:metallophosphoesterase [Pelotomaculum isophthalicicum]MDF9408831.1 metallophosphoesterase [Pelotomaculum isophthalicicum JI]OPX89782.1 MAG: putative metallophosphoesterase [Pelotomaculum sp. PtaB.Bin013]
MKLQFAIFIGVFIAIYGTVNYYIGLRGWQAFGRLIPDGYGKIYWFLFFLLAFSYLAGRLGERYLPAAVCDGFTIAGSYWLAAINYLFFTLIAVDLIRLADRWLGFLPEGLKQRPVAAGLAVVLLVVGIVIYGAWNSRNPQFRYYDIDIAKPAGSLSQLHVIMVSDIHLGKIVNNGRLMTLVNMINSKNPDLVLLPGDIIDENIGPFIEQKMPDVLRMLKPKYGTFAVFGNHEYIGGHAEEAFHHLQEAGITVLRDDYKKVDGSFYIVGRDESSGGRYNGKRRQELSALMEGVDHSLPVILLDHQPSHLEEGQEQGVDLQLSGHTHHGQLFPFNLITQRIFEEDWGYLRKGDFQIIVSCGFGTWGPPIRIGSTPEIVDITIHFNNVSEQPMYSLR